jgi:hypothetical protein
VVSPETRVQIRRYFYAEHWKIGTIARQLNVHPDAVRNAIESDLFNRTKPLRSAITDPYMDFVRRLLDQHPRLRATRIYQMIRERGYTGSVIQLRRAVALLRPPAREPFLRLQAFPAEHYGKSRVMVRSGAVPSFLAGNLRRVRHIMRYRASSHSMRLDDRRGVGACVGGGPFAESSALRFISRSA